MDRCAPDAAIKRKVLKDDALQRLAKLEEFLRPKDLENSVRGIVLGEIGGPFDLE